MIARQENEFFDVIQFNDQLHDAEAQASIAFRTEPILKRNWEIARSVGRVIFEKKVFPLLKEKKPSIDLAEFRQQWDEFMDAGFSALEQIADDLDIEPTIIEVDYWQKMTNSLAAASRDEDGKTTLHLFPYGFITYFLAFTNARFPLFKVAAQKSYESVLAHEMRHLYQYKKYPHAMENEKNKRSYWDRRYEYSARLYSLRWLRQQTGTSVTETIGLWLARAEVLFTQIHHQKHIGEKMLAGKKPAILENVRLIFTDKK